MADRLLLNGRVLDIGRAELCDSTGQVAALRPQALYVLLELARRSGEVVTKRDLMARVWPGIVVTDDSLVQCIVEIRRALGDTEQRIVRTMPRRGYCLVPDSEAAHGQSDSSVGRSPRRALFAIAGMAVLALSMWLFDMLGHGVVGRTAPSKAGLAVVVLPLRELNVGTGDTVPSGEGLAYVIAGELARNRDLHVVSTLVASELRRKGIGTREIGSMSGARYVVDGSVERRGDRLGLEFHLIDATDDRIAWSGRFEPTARDLPGVTQTLIEQISGSLGSTVRELAVSATLSRAPASLDAHALALHGIALAQQRGSSDGLRQARRELEQATALDPGYAPAWAHLGLVKTLLIFSRNDPSLGLQDHAQALDEIRHAIALDPSLASSWQLLSVAIDSTEHPAEAVQAAERAVHLAPGDPDNFVALSLAQYHAGQLDAALQNFEKAVSWNRGLRPPSYSVVEARLRYALRDYENALRSAHDCMERVPAIAVCKAIWLSSQIRAGHTGEAEAAWPRLVATTPRLESYRYAPRGTQEAREIDQDLDRLRTRAQASTYMTSTAEEARRRSK